MKNILWLVFALALSACATPDIRPIPADRVAAWKMHQQLIGKLRSWDLRARIAVQAGEDGGQASLLWNLQHAKNDLRLIGVWGKGLVRLSFDAHTAELTDKSGQKISGADASQLLYQATGWVIPVRSLQSWMAGVPVSDQAETRLDRYGRLAQVIESGWQVEYQEYQQFGQWELPKKLKLVQVQTFDGEQQISVRLVVNQWQVKS